MLSFRAGPTPILNILVVVIDKHIEFLIVSNLEIAVLKFVL